MRVWYFVLGEGVASPKFLSRNEAENWMRQRQAMMPATELHMYRDVENVAWAITGGYPSVTVVLA